MKRLLTLATAAATAATAVTSGIARRGRRLNTVAPDLRHPLLYVPLTVHNLRTLRVARRLPLPNSPVVAGVTVRTEEVPQNAGRPASRVLIYEADDRSRLSGAMIWIHGGGLVMGSPEQGHALCSRFAAELGVLVISVDYRLAPEHPFPAGLDDCYASLAWAHENADRLGIDRGRVAVGGDSAGGGLAACLAQRARDSGEGVCFQLLQYPMLDDRTAVQADHNTIIWTSRSNKYAWSAYLGHPLGVDETRPYASAARLADMRELAPAWIGVGDIDLFHNECVNYADRLRDAGVHCDLHIVSGMYHGAEQLAPGAAAMQDFLGRMISALGNAMLAVHPNDGVNLRRT